MIICYKTIQQWEAPLHLYIPSPVENDLTSYHTATGNSTKTTAGGGTDKEEEKTREAQSRTVANQTTSSAADVRSPNLTDTMCFAASPTEKRCDWLTQHRHSPTTCSDKSLPNQFVLVQTVGHGSFWSTMGSQTAPPELIFFFLGWLWWCQWGTELCSRFDPNVSVTATVARNINTCSIGSLTVLGVRLKIQMDLSVYNMCIYIYIHTQRDTSRHG